MIERKERDGENISIHRRYSITTLYYQPACSVKYRNKTPTSSETIDKYEHLSKDQKSILAMQHSRPTDPCMPLSVLNAGKWWYIIIDIESLLVMSVNDTIQRGIE